MVFLSAPPHSGLSFVSLAWQRPTFPGVCTPSILGAGGLHGRVRDGYGCCPSAMATRLVFTVPVDLVHGSYKRVPWLLNSSSCALEAATGGFRATRLR
jgi:hypothetical protein